MAINANLDHLSLLTALISSQLIVIGVQRHRSHEENSLRCQYCRGIPDYKAYVFVQVKCLGSLYTSLQNTDA